MLWKITSALSNVAGLKGELQEREGDYDQVNYTMAATYIDMACHDLRMAFDCIKRASYPVKEDWSMRYDG